ncbi:MAG TPA: class I SAM-dependent methyltransferase [Bacteroidales bacterium]|nr:class I SAM-dependent methyltransferase [Bacteroidales bacterium]
MSITCPFCHNNHSIFQWETTDLKNQTWALYQCQACHFYFLNPFPTPKQLEEAYTQDYYGAGEKKFSFPLVENVLDFFRSGRARKLNNYLNKNTSSFILDVGCGNGRFLYYLQKIGLKNLYGIELPGNSAERASKIPFLNIKIEEIEHAHYPADFFDAITMFHVLEHMKNPIQILQKMTSWLKDEGIFMVSFPNIASKQAQKYRGMWLHMDPPRHLNFITPNDFIRHMNQLGFEHIESSYFSLEQNPYGYVQSFLNKKSKKREILFESMKGNINYLKDVPKKTLFFHRLFFILSTPYYILLDLIESWQKKSGTVTFVFKKKSYAKR